MDSIQPGKLALLRKYYPSVKPSSPRESKPRVPTVIARHFGWLERLGFAPVEASESWGPSATYARDAVLVRPSYEEREEYPEITVARRRAADLGEEPYWAQVHLHELLERRAPESSDWTARRPGRRRKDAIEAALAHGADLLRTYGADLLEGRNLDVLDDIIDKRPRLGVPGLDYPTSEPWALSAEGVLFTTDSEMPRDMATLLEKSTSPDPTARAVAALKIVIAARGTRDRRLLAAGHDRLHVLLADPDADVYRAAASALGEWSDTDALDEVLALLEKESGDRMSPLAAAATFLALGGSKVDKQRVLEALGRFASRHPVAAGQVDQLAWRLGRGKSRGYSRVVRLYRGPDE